MISFFASMPKLQNLGATLHMSLCVKGPLEATNKAPIQRLWASNIRVVTEQGRIHLREDIIVPAIPKMGPRIAELVRSSSLLKNLFSEEVVRGFVPISLNIMKWSSGLEPEEIIMLGEVRPRTLAAEKAFIEREWSWLSPGERIGHICYLARDLYK